MLYRALILAIAVAASGNLYADDEDYSWCQGYVVKALGEFPVDGLNRTHLWLAWNTTVDNTIATANLNQASYQAGRNRFDELYHLGDSAAIQAVTEERCNLGREPGWRWW